MALTLEHPNFRIIDDLLDEQTWTSVWSDFQFMELHPVTRTLGAWKLDDGVPLGGNEVVVARTEAIDPNRRVLAPFERIFQPAGAVDHDVLELCRGIRGQ